MIDSKKLLPVCTKACLLAGIETLKYFKKDININIKEDSSPLTQADLNSNMIIEEILKNTNIPIISEESKILEYDERSKWDLFWLVDPLDGTKEFINGRNEYTVNIGLIYKNIPILGVVYAPVLDVLYFGNEKDGAYRVKDASNFLKDLAFPDWAKERLPLNELNEDEIVVVASKSHLNKETTRFIEEIGLKSSKIKIENYGSSLKLCKVAEGTAHIYPRIAPTMEWDTAASHAILISSNCSLKQYPGFKGFNYNKEKLLNPWFVVFNNKYRELIESINIG